jgi:hypothetical protein
VAESGAKAGGHRIRPEVSGWSIVVPGAFRPPTHRG